MVGRVSYLGRVKQGYYYTRVIYHTEPKLHISQTRSFHNNPPYPPPYFGEQHYPTLDTYFSLPFWDQKRIAAFQLLSTALFKTNFNFMFFLKLDNMK